MLTRHLLLQAEHNSSQNALFELSSQREEQETARHHEAEQAAADLEEAHKKLRQEAHSAQLAQDLCIKIQ